MNFGGVNPGTLYISAEWEYGWDYPVFYCKRHQEYINTYTIKDGNKKEVACPTCFWEEVKEDQVCAAVLRQGIKESPPVEPVLTFDEWLATRWVDKDENSSEAHAEDGDWTTEEEDELTPPEAIGNIITWSAQLRWHYD